MAAAVAAAAAEQAVTLDDAKLREARWQRAMAGEDVPLLRDAANIRPRGTKRDGTTMADCRQVGNGDVRVRYCYM